MKFRDIKAHLKIHPYFKALGEIHRVNSISTYSLNITTLDDNKEYYWKYRQFFRQHKCDIKLFITKEQAIAKYPEYFI